MSVELLVNASPYETRIARVENGLAEELYIERERGRGIKGNIYKGRVQRVLPGIQAAFIDIGLSRAGFLYAGDIAIPEGDVNGYVEPAQESDDPESAEKKEEPVQTTSSIPPIASMLEEGQEIIVQVSKEPIASKGPRLTTLTSLAGRYLVYLPNLRHVGIARRIEDTAERERLLETGQALLPETGGLIIRTAAEGRHLFELEQDLKFLLKLWKDIDKRLQHAAPGSMAHMDLNLYLRVMRDYVDDEVAKIHIDSREAYDRMKKFARRFMPEIVKRLYYYPGERPIFDVYGVEDEINRALKRCIPLKSGGSIVIEQTEALIAIDVNSGSFVGSRNLEETGFKTNLEAIQEIAHQLRLRNLGGIIVIDFIDIQEEEHKSRLMEMLEVALDRDKAKTNVIRMSELGLVEMTRKRTRDSLGRTLLRDCSHCFGIGRTKSLITICYQIFREVMAESRAYPCNKLMVVAHPDIIDLLVDEESENVGRLELFVNKKIGLNSSPDLAPDQYEIVLL
ncbi:MAG: ribonuclease E/G [Mariprofundaceae bacterium]